MKEVDKQEEERLKSNPLHAQVRAQRAHIQFDGLDEFLTAIEDAYQNDPFTRYATEEYPWQQIENRGHKLWYKISEGDEKLPRLYIPNNNQLKEMIMKQHHETLTTGHTSKYTTRTDDPKHNEKIHMGRNGNRN